MEKIIQYLMKNACAENCLASMWDYVSEGEFGSAMRSHLLYLVVADEAREVRSTFTEQDWLLLGDVLEISSLGNVSERK